MNATCKCHGVSGSCTVKTCWKQLTPFRVLGSLLKEKFLHSQKVVISENEATGKSYLVRRRQVKSGKAFSENTARPKAGDLVYIDRSPNFCRKTRYSPGTAGRTCDKDKTCDIMCCGRGYNVQTHVFPKACNCKVIWCCYVKCQKCVATEELYTCK